MSDTPMPSATDDGSGDAVPPGDAVPAEQRCVWPGCGRRRAPGRTAGSGRQKEYCLQADPHEAGGGPVHNARNRWAALRSGANRAAAGPADGDDDGFGEDRLERGSDTARLESVSGASGPDQFAFSAAKKRASELLEQARWQHAAAIASLRTERELYQQLAEQLTALTDPASLDLEIAAVASRAGAAVARAEEDAARARRAQLAAERERDDAIRLRVHADAAAEQLAADTEAAEATLGERAAAFDRDHAELLRRARDAQEHADRADAETAAAKTAAEQATADAVRSVSEVRERAAAEIAAARTRADDRAREQVEAAQARADAQVAAAIAAAARERGSAQQARDEAARARQEHKRELADAQFQLAAARADAATAGARAGAAAAESERARDEIGRLRDEIRRLDATREAEVSRLTAAHQAALEAERGRVTRAETELDTLRGAAP